MLILDDRSICTIVVSSVCVRVSCCVFLDKMSGTEIEIFNEHSMAENIVDMSVEISSLPNIFKLNDFCFEDIFEWLSIDDLKILRQTCSRMKEIVDYYITLNYPVSLQCLRMDSIRCEEILQCKEKYFGTVNRFQLSEKPQYPFSELEEILSHVETIEIECEFPRCDFYDEFLKRCTNLRNLMIRMPHLSVGGDKKWLHQHYPTMEHIGFECNSQCIELKGFLEKNPNVKIISTTFTAIWENREWLLTSDIHIDRLILCKGFLSNVHIELACNVLNQLHERGFYKRLHLYYYERDVNVLPQITSLQSVESLLYFGSGWSHLSSFNCLKELHILDFFDEINLDALTNSLINLRRICIHFTSFDNILPLIRHCPKLKQIRITFLQILNGSNNEKIDLLALNDERAKLPNATKITIFLNEQIFLQNKWNQPINLDLIALKRHLSWKPMDLFYPVYGRNIN